MDGQGRGRGQDTGLADITLSSSPYGMVPVSPNTPSGMLEAESLNNLGWKGPLEVICPSGRTLAGQI